jgi:hypothetical protein
MTGISEIIGLFGREQEEFVDYKLDSGDATGK